MGQPLRPSGLPITSLTRHGLTEWTGPAHSAQRSRAESCAIVSPIELRGSQVIGLSLIMRQAIALDVREAVGGELFNRRMQRIHRRKHQCVS